MEDNLIMTSQHPTDNCNDSSPASTYFSLFSKTPITIWPPVCFTVSPILSPTKAAPGAEICMFYPLFTIAPRTVSSTQYVFNKCLSNEQNVSQFMLLHLIMHALDTHKIDLQ